jgi:hypothetical protein
MTEPTATPLLPSAAYSRKLRASKIIEMEAYNNLSKNAVILGLDVNGGLVCLLTQKVE